jgi:hypothetical protein
MGKFFYTASGRKIRFDSAGFDQSLVCVEDIARHLLAIPRFGGAARRFYPVLRHALLVEALAPATMARQALLHDAAEAYLGDVVSPVKAAVPSFAMLEKQVITAIYAALKLQLPSAEEEASIHLADQRAFATEAFFLGPPGLWEDLGKPRDAIAEAHLTRILDLPAEECILSFIERTQVSPGCASTSPCSSPPDPGSFSP